MREEQTNKIASKARRKTNLDLGIVAVLEVGLSRSGGFFFGSVFLVDVAVSFFIIDILRIPRVIDIADRQRSLARKALNGRLVNLLHNIGLTHLECKFTDHVPF